MRAGVNLLIAVPQNLDFSFLVWNWSNSHVRYYFQVCQKRLSWSWTCQQVSLLFTSWTRTWSHWDLCSSWEMRKQSRRPWRRLLLRAKSKSRIPASEYGSITCCLEIQFIYHLQTLCICKTACAHTDFIFKNSPRFHRRLIYTGGIVYITHHTKGTCWI